MSQNDIKFICAPQFMFSSGGTVRIFIYFRLKCILKGLRTCVQCFGKICWPVFDLRTSHQIDTTQAKLCISDPKPNPNSNFNPTRAVHQNAPKWLKIYMLASVYVHFWRYFKNYFYFFDSNVLKGWWTWVQSFWKI